MTANTNTQTSNNQKSSPRSIFSVQKPEIFWNRVHNRLHMAVERYIFQSKGIEQDGKTGEAMPKFTLIVNAIPRDSEFG